MKYSDLSQSFAGFSKLTWDERLQMLKDFQVISTDEFTQLKTGSSLDISLGEKFIENLVGYFQMPMGVATNFRIDGEDFFIPMAVEETSIIAAASKTAKLVREHGEITTRVIGTDIIGQVQIAKVKDFQTLEIELKKNKDQWIESANTKIAHGLVARGGGVKDLNLRSLKRPDGGIMAVIHVLMDPVDAMGANIINQVCEFLKTPIQNVTGETVTMCILSNLVDTKLTEATVKINLSSSGIDLDLAKKIEEASLFSQLDPYRAATNNKGVLNGIDPILIATGNDWRAVEAGVHAFAAVNTGTYSSITQWKVDQQQLVGVLKAPLIVGIVGGVTTLHPMAKLALKMLRVKKATDLSRILAAVGLVQNLGALKALSTVGIIEGHMKLHLKNLSLGAGARDEEIPQLVKKLESVLSLQKRISLSDAIVALKELRQSL